MWRLRKDIFGLGLAQVVLCGLALVGVHQCRAQRVSREASLAIGLPLALSSTAQVLPMLRSAGSLHTRRGERAFSILLLQDLALVPMITIIAAMSRAPPDPDQPSGAMMALLTVGAIAGLVLAGRLILNPMFRLIGRFGERELFVVAGLFTVMAASALMHMLHLSVALGAFVAGVMLAESPYRHELESDVEPFRSILLGLFFLSVGMTLDLPVIADRPLLMVGIAAGMIAIKGVIIAVLTRLFGGTGGGGYGSACCSARRASSASCCSPRRRRPADPARGGQPVRRGRDPVDGDDAVPDAADRLARPARCGEPATISTGPTSRPKPSPIVVGYGRFGQTVAQMLQAKKIGVTLIDKKPSMIERADEFGTKVYYGDGLRLDLLRTAGAENARLIAFCNDNKDGEMTARGDGRGARGVSAGGGAGPRLRPGSSDGARPARPRLRPARNVRKRDQHGPRGAEAGGGRGAKSTGSSAHIGCAIASGSSGRAPPAIFMPGRSGRSGPTMRCPTRMADGQPDTPPPARASLGRGPGQIIIERGEDRIDDVAVRAVAAPHMDVRLGIGRSALVRQSLERALGIRVAEQAAGCRGGWCARPAPRPAHRARR